MPKNLNKNNPYTYAVGRRRSAVATIKLYPSKGDSQVNKISLDKYFPGSAAKVNYQQPFTVTDTENKYHFESKIIGGGKHGQLQALALAISRALQKHHPEMTVSLRAAGLLTVDSRVRQRRMVGTGGKARRQKQSPKR